MFRNFTVLISVLLIFAGVPSRVRAQGKIVFDEMEHSFGKIKEEAGKVRYKFVCRNTGDKKAVITEVKPSCGCTTADYSKDSLLPGGRGYVIIQYDPLHRPGKFDKGVVVLNSGKPAETVLKISGEVIPRAKQPRDLYPFKDGYLRFRTNHFVFGKMLNTETRSLSSVIYNESPRPIVFDLEKTWAALPKHLKFRCTKKSILPGDTATITVQYNASLKSDWGFCFDNFMLFTNDVTLPVKKINVSAEISEKFDPAASATAPRATFDKTSHDFGNSAASESPVATFVISNKGKSDLIVRKIQEFCPCTQAKIDKQKIPPGESATIKIEFVLTGRTGAQEKELRVITNDPSNPSQTLWIKAFVKSE